MPELPELSDPARVTLIGLGATALMDAWLLTLSRLGVPFAGFGLVGRWVGHMASGRFRHAAIARAEPVRGERALGWITHYLVGIGFAAVLVALLGTPWLHRPTVGPALVFGVLTVAAPLCLMQPAMGAGFASAKTATPGLNRLRSLLNHTVFGLGLYAAATMTQRLA